MNYRNRMLPGAMVMMVGLLPLAASQAQAQSTDTDSLLRTEATILPSDAWHQDTDKNNVMLGDLTLTDTDLLGGSQETFSLPHAGSGLSSGWLIGGGLGAAAGLIGLASGGGSSATSGLLRTPTSLPGPVFGIEPGATNLGGGSTLSGAGGSSVSTGSTISATGGSSSVSGGSTISGLGSGSVLPIDSTNAGSSGVSSGGGTFRPLSDPSGSGGSIGPSLGIQDTPEPGAMALFGGMGLVLTALKLRRRKR